VGTYISLIVLRTGFKVSTASNVSTIDLLRNLAMVS
jgi:hypothetical protein